MHLQFMVDNSAIRRELKKTGVFDRCGIKELLVTKFTYLLQPTLSYLALLLVHRLLRSQAAVPFLPEILYENELKMPIWLQLKRLYLFGQITRRL